MQLNESNAVQRSGWRNGIIEVRRMRADKAEAEGVSETADEVGWRRIAANTVAE